MTHNTLATARKGITPVVAIVLLLMLTVAVAGGAYAWVNGMIGDQKEQANKDLNTKVAVKNLACNAVAGTGNPDVSFFLKNSGSIEVPGGDITVYLYNVSDGSLVEVASKDIDHDGDGVADPFEPTGDNSQWNGDVEFSADLKAAREYEVEWEFTGGQTVKSSCRAS